MTLADNTDSFNCRIESTELNATVWMAWTAFR
jgi:hypothetical protein